MAEKAQGLPVPAIAGGIVVALAVAIVAVVMQMSSGEPPSVPGGPQSAAIRPAQPVVGERIEVKTVYEIDAGSFKSVLETVIVAEVTQADVDDGRYAAKAWIESSHERVTEEDKTTEVTHPTEEEKGAGWPRKVDLKGGLEALSLASLAARTEAQGDFSFLEGVTALGRRKTIDVGTEEVAQGPVKSGAVTLPVRKAFKVKSIEDAGGETLIHVAMQTDGQTSEIPQMPGITYTLRGRGEAVVPADAADRPRSIDVTYEITATSSEGEDSRSTTRIQITTQSSKP